LLRQNRLESRLGDDWSQRGVCGHDRTYDRLLESVTCEEQRDGTIATYPATEG